MQICSLHERRNLSALVVLTAVTDLRRPNHHQVVVDYAVFIGSEQTSSAGMIATSLGFWKPVSPFNKAAILHRRAGRENKADQPSASSLVQCMPAPFFWSYSSFTQGLFCLAEGGERKRRDTSIASIKGSSFAQESHHHVHHVPGVSQQKPWKHGPEQVGEVEF